MLKKTGLKNICVFCDGYPTEDDPQFAFIRPVVCAMADLGIHCTVIAPQSITRILLKKVKARKTKWIDYTEKGKRIYIIQPYTITLSTLIKTYKLTELICRRSYFQNKINADVLYGHFWKSGIRAASIAQRKGLPVIVASGEANIDSEIDYRYKEIHKRLNQISGVICVSTRNLDESKRLNLITEKMRETVLLNGYNEKAFFKIDRKVARKEIGIDEDLFIGIAVGEYSKRKGTERIIKAAQGVPELRLMLIGDGDNISDTRQVIVSGVKPHNKLVYYLNAADFFILPTLAEGCCNAIIEAIACGLPVISSDLPFNRDILDESNSILVDPMDITSIQKAIVRLYENIDLRKQLSYGSIQRAKSLTINQRTEKIIRFIEDVVSERDGNG